VVGVGVAPLEVAVKVWPGVELLHDARTTAAVMPPAIERARDTRRARSITP
jgi:hypothetical protein